MKKFNKLYNIEERKKWDENIVEYKILKEISPGILHYYMINRIPYPFKNRDFVEKRTSFFVKELNQHVILYNQIDDNVLYLYKYIYI